MGKIKDLAVLQRELEDARTSAAVKESRLADLRKRKKDIMIWFKVNGFDTNGDLGDLEDQISAVEESIRTDTEELLGEMSS